MANSFKELKEEMSPERRDKIETRAQALLINMALQELRQTRNLTQQDLANIMDVKQAALSKNGTSIRYAYKYAA